MSTQSSAKNYWMHPNALTIGLNALNNPNYIQVSVLSAAKFMAYIPGVIGYDAAGNFRSWLLQASNTKLDSASIKYVYARLAIDTNINTALIVYSDTQYYVDGTPQGAGTAITGYYFIYLGTISATSNGSERSWITSIDSGSLNTDQHFMEESQGEWTRMFQLNKITDLIETLKTFASIKANSLEVVNNATFFDKLINALHLAADSENESDTALATSGYTAKHVKDKALSRVNADTALELIKFIKGIALGNSGMGIDGNGLATLLGITTTGFDTGPLGSGFTLKTRPDGSTYLEVDDALFRKSATFIQLIIQELAHVGGMMILSAARIKCIKVTTETAYYRCYFQSELDGRTIPNQFVVGDYARCQTFNVATGNQYYWRRVVAIGTDYIDLSRLEYDAGSKEPKAGDDICQLGNALDVSRQGAIILSAVGNDSPSIKIYKGINNCNSAALEGKRKISISPSGFIVEADFFQFSTGKTVQDMIDSIKVGGRNLIKNSGEFQSTDGWGTIGLGNAALSVVDGCIRMGSSSVVCEQWGQILMPILNTPLELGKQYTYSVCLKSNHSNVRLGLRATEEGMVLYQEDFINATHDYRVFTYTFTHNNSSYIPQYPVILPVVFSNNTTAVWLDIKYAKLEEGNVSTAWTPSELDIVNRLEATGIYVEQGLISVVADKFKIKAPNGQEYAVFEMVNGVPTVKASSIDTTKLVAKRLATANRGARIEIEGSELSVFGNLAKNIEFGVNADGMAVMRYLDNDGRLLYDLGPDGINKIPVSLESWVEYNMKACGTNIAAVFANMLYKSNELAEGTMYYKFYSRITAGSVEKPNIHLRTFRTQSELGLYIPDGYYIKVSASPVKLTSPTQETGERIYPEGIHASNPAVYDRYPLYIATLLQYSSGLGVSTINVYWNG